MHQRRAWRKLHIGLNAEASEIVAAELTTNDVDDASQVSSLLGQVARPVAGSPVMARRPEWRLSCRGGPPA